MALPAGYHPDMTAVYLSKSLGSADTLRVAASVGVTTGSFSQWVRFTARGMSLLADVVEGGRKSGLEEPDSSSQRPQFARARLNLTDGQFVNAFDVSLTT